MSTAMEMPGTGIEPYEAAAVIHLIRFLSSSTFASSTNCDLSLRLRTEMKEGFIAMEVSVMSSESPKTQAILNCAQLCTTLFQNLSMRMDYTGEVWS